MTVNERIDTPKKGDAVTAQLALAAEENGQETAGKGACLTSDQLAAIAMGRSTAEEKEQAMGHFADCKKCYDALVAISFSLASVERSGSRSRSASTVRNLTWLGSAFAIAASVLVFFNIREVPKDLDQQNFTPSAPVLEQSMVEPAPAQEALSDAVAPKAKALQKRVVPEAMTLDEERELAAGQEAVGAKELERWMSDIASACISKNEDRGQWLSLRARGSAVVASVADLDRTAHLQQIVDLLSESGEPPTPKQCSRIFTLLAQQSEWE